MKGIFKSLLSGKALTTKNAVVAAAASVGFIFATVNAQEVEKWAIGGLKQATPECQAAEGLTGRGKPVSARFNHGAYMIPHHEKRDKGGEDAYVSSDELIVVADGVGGWSQMGIDPGLFSKALVKFIEEEFKKNPKGSLKQFLINAVARNRHIGSSTAVLATMDVKDDGVVAMRTCNLGDSGYVIFRAPSLGSTNQEPLEVYFRSKEQQYSFNFPYQCGTQSESPALAFDIEHEMKDRDIVVMGSDGLFDNLYHEDILTCLYP
jgi:protein phosphatase PTC7